MLGEFAAFLRDSIKRDTISGITLSVEALANGREGFGAIFEAYNIIPLRVNHILSDLPLLQYLGQELTPQEDV